ncbi:MAG: TPR_REGION domain-containing protein [Marine Group I thaumarchaeote]|nr:MAG: TPR_REGION domain-containing protein [Marine Group I thaumarchaeote]
MKKLFGKKSVKKEKKTSIVDADYARNKYFKKGINFMADEKMEDACETFEMALRIDPNHVDSLLKLGYAHFHLDDYNSAMKAYDRVLQIDVTNADAWNLEGLVYYEQKNYAKALDCVEKSIESEPTFGMGWYNKSCYLSLLNQVPDALDALKRSIEIDVKNAKRAVKDPDFLNVRVEEGFRRIVQVVVLESIRQGYHNMGQIVWTTFLSKKEVEDATRKLILKGLITVHEKRQGLQRVPTWDLVPQLVDKLGAQKRGLLGPKKIRVSSSIKELKEVSETIQLTKMAIEKGDVEEILTNFEQFIDPAKKGSQMIDHFFEEHRDIRLYKIRLKERGSGYLSLNKDKLLELLDKIDLGITKKLRTEITQS